MNIYPLPAENSKRKAMRRFFFILLGLSATLAFGQITFSTLDLAEDNTLLFKATTVAPANGSYDTVFLSDVEAKAITQLSFFPEIAMLTGDANNVQLINRFGVFRSDDEMNLFKPVTRFPSFVNGSEIASGKLNVPSSSPDGRYLLIMSKNEKINSVRIITFSSIKIPIFKISLRFKWHDSNKALRSIIRCQ